MSTVSKCPVCDSGKTTTEDEDYPLDYLDLVGDQGCVRCTAQWDVVDIDTSNMDHECPFCGSSDVTKSDGDWPYAGTVPRTYGCCDCGRSYYNRHRRANVVVRPRVSFGK